MRMNLNLIFALFIILKWSCYLAFTCTYKYLSYYYL